MKYRPLKGSQFHTPGSQRTLSPFRTTAILILAVACLGIFGLAETSLHAQVNAAGVWDFSISGSGRGTAILELHQDGTLEGVIIRTPLRINKQTTKINSRNGVVEGASDTQLNPRTGGVDEVSDNMVSTNRFIGSAIVTGMWFSEGTKAIVGFFNEESNVGESNEVTNPVSFRASVKPGRLLNMRAYGGDGKWLFRGRPNGTAPDVTGTFLVSGRRAGFQFIETFTLTPAAAPDVPPGIYDVAGSGPNFTFTGFALITGSGQFSLFEVHDDSSLTSLTGSYNALRRSALLKGFNNIDELLSYRVLMQ